MVHEHQCRHCRHWCMLKPHEEHYSRNSPGVVGKCRHPTPNPGLGTLQIALATDGCHQFEAEMPSPIKPICRNCTFWTNYGSTLMGHCTNPNFVHTGHYYYVPLEGLSYGDYDGYSAGLRTGEAFSCIHHQPKEGT